MKMPTLILFTGGPGSGKTTLINEFQRQGFSIVPDRARELIRARQLIRGRELIRSNHEQRIPSSNMPPKTINVEQMVGRFFEICLHDYRRYLIKRQQHSIIFFDMGVLEAAATLIQSASSIANMKQTNIMKIISTIQFDAVFLFPPWADIYVQDRERQHSFQHAQNVYQQLCQWYSQLGIQPLTIPKTNVTERVQFVLDNLPIKL